MAEKKTAALPQEELHPKQKAKPARRGAWKGKPAKKGAKAEAAEAAPAETAPVRAEAPKAKTNATQNKNYFFQNHFAPFLSYKIIVPH